MLKHKNCSFAWRGIFLLFERLSNNAIKKTESICCQMAIIVKWPIVLPEAGICGKYM